MSKAKQGLQDTGLMGLVLVFAGIAEKALEQSTPLSLGVAVVAGVLSLGILYFYHRQ